MQDKFVVYSHGELITMGTLDECIEVIKSIPMLAEYKFVSYEPQPVSPIFLD